MNKATKIFVVVPVYNEQANIQKLLNSLFVQKYTNKKNLDLGLFKIIIVDNNSTDNTVRVVKRFEKNHPLLNIEIIKEAKKGIIPARVAGFNYVLDKNKQLKEFIIASTDADVIVNENWIDGIIKTFKKTKADFLVGDSYFGKSFWQQVPHLGAWIRNIKKDLLQVENDLVFMLGGANFAITNKLYGKINKGLSDAQGSDRVFGSNAKLVNGRFAILPYVNIVSHRRFVYIIEDLASKGTYGVPASDVRETEKNTRQQMRKIDKMAKQGYFDDNKFIKFFLRDYLFVPLLFEPSLLQKHRHYFIDIEKEIKQQITKYNKKDYWNNLNLAVKRANRLTNKYWRRVYRNIKKINQFKIS